jgi:hypothetical protein
LTSSLCSTVEHPLDVLSVERVLDACKTLFTIEQHYVADTPLGGVHFFVAVRHVRTRDDARGGRLLSADMRESP